MKKYSMKSIPHPIPYQGSKRKLAPVINSVMPRDIRCFYEPFAGSAAMTLFMAGNDAAERFVVGDKFPTLIKLWEMIVENPHHVIDEYAAIWKGFDGENHNYFNDVRERYNATQDPVALLYLVCRCVKNAVRFNAKGRFTQSADKRRKGMAPEKMAIAVEGASKLLKGRVEFRIGDWQVTSGDAETQDFVYMDPPYLGTSIGKDKRYHEQLDRDSLVSGLALLNTRDIRFALSYDGMTGDKEYGPALPEDLMMSRLLINAGQSSQATLNGLKAETVESLYLSSNLKTPAKTRLYLKDIHQEALFS
ncbi:TPA: DNA adenine methylase [Enterobacter soli]|uniref:DNA adenine methylase n=1 Tax=Enterobacter sp. CP102 TaxID=2976431 RepID=UPI00220D38DD|nr:DNA adenine methylase [Enterobacter sp. CP102]UWM63413.1 DNA adenine methylase [Enterobacter sp. CP102]HDX4050452.1 DNA adenine methylase [Enterobacter soli]